LLHDRVRSLATTKGRREPPDTSAIYTVAASEAPDLLDQLLLVHHRVRQEQGEVDLGDTPPANDDGERRRMLSAIRATVQRSSARFNV
jgi:hypothetical protein